MGGKKLSDWTREPIKGIKTVKELQLSTALKYNESGKGTKVKENYLGQLLCTSNNVYKNKNDVSLYSAPNSAGNSHSITPSNFNRSTCAFAARKLIAGNWMNDTDEYFAPNESHGDFAQFKDDAVVFSIFHTASQQSSLRQISFMNKLWDVKNKFFWLGKQVLIDLADEHGFDELYQDARYSNERYVHKLLSGGVSERLSPEAKAVMDAANDLLIKSFPMRVMMHEEHPEYHLQARDAGYDQLKRVWKQFFPEEFKEFRLTYRSLSDKMRPLVYELGF